MSNTTRSDVLSKFSASEALKLVNEVFTIQHYKGGTIWQVLLYSNSQLVQEQLNGPEPDYELEESYRKLGFFPTHIAFKDALKYISAFQNVFMVLGVMLKYTNPPQNFSWHTIYAALESGRDSIDLLHKSLLIVEHYYRKHAEDSIGNALEMIEICDFITKYFKAKGVVLDLSFGEPHAPLPLSKLKWELSDLSNLILKMDNGDVRGEYSNNNGAICIYINGAVNIVIDPKVNRIKKQYVTEELYTNMRMPLYNRGIYTSNYPISSGTHTVIIPSGVNLPLVLDALVESQFIDRNQADIILTRIL